MSVNGVGMTSKRFELVSIAASDPGAVPHETCDQARGGFEGVGRHAELPLRASEFGLHRRHGLDRPVALAIEIPPARTSIRDEIKIAVRRPFRLEHQLVPPARDAARISDCPVLKNVADPRLGRHPGHVGVAPREPGQAASVGAETRRRIEVVSRDEHPGRGASGKVDGDERRDRLARAAMILPDADHAPPATIDDSIGVAQRIRRAACGNGRNRAWRAGLPPADKAADRYCSRNRSPRR